MSISKQEFTNAGRDMLGRAQASERLTISKICVGSGAATQPSDLWPLTQPIQLQLYATISSARNMGNGIMMVEGNFRSDQATAPFDLREIGIMAHIGTEADRLYSVANCLTDPPDHIDPAAPTMQVFKIKLVVDRVPTDQVTVTIGASEAVMGENVGDDTVGPGWYKDTQGNVLRFKRAIAGARISLTEDALEDTVTIAVKTVDRDVDLYVPLTYPGITDPATLFPTIQAALDSVADLIIPADKFVTVHVWSGNFTQAVPIMITHPNSSQIKIVGHDLIQLPVTGTITVTGAVPNFDVTVNCLPGTQVAVGDVVQLFNAPTGLLESAGYVETVLSNSVKFRLYSNFAPSNIAAAANTKLVLFPSQIQTNVPAGINLFQANYGIGLIKNLALRNTLTTKVGEGVTMIGDGVIENMAMLGFYSGFAVRNGTLTINPTVVATQCEVGFEVAPFAGCIVGAPSADGYNRLVLSGNLGYGLWVNGGSYYSISNTNTYCNANTSSGIRCDHGYCASGNFPGTTGGMVVCWNDVGCDAALQGALFTTLAATNIIFGNVTWDCRAASGSQIGIVHNINATGKYSPANHVLGPDGAYVAVATP